LTSTAVRTPVESLDPIRSDPLLCCCRETECQGRNNNSETQRGVVNVIDRAFRDDPLLSLDSSIQSTTSGRPSRICCARGPLSFHLVGTGGQFLNQHGTIRCSSYDVHRLAPTEIQSSCKRICSSRFASAGTNNLPCRGSLLYQTWAWRRLHNTVDVSLDRT